LAIGIDMWFKVQRFWVQRFRGSEVQGSEIQRKAICFIGPIGSISFIG
jgi:hypothetical protein